MNKLNKFNLSFDWDVVVFNGRKAVNVLSKLLVNMDLNLLNFVDKLTNIHLFLAKFISELFNIS